VYIGLFVCLSLQGQWILPFGIAELCVCNMQWPWYIGDHGGLEVKTFERRVQGQQQQRLSRRVIFLAIKIGNELNFPEMGTSTALFLQLPGCGQLRVDLDLYPFNVLSTTAIS
jgi:hypothetical protein